MTKNISIYQGAILLLLITGLAWAGSGEWTQSVLKPRPIAEAPKIDGKLDDTAWQANPILKDYFTSYHPVDGTKLPQHTKVWAAYDSENLYFAFYCHDTEAHLIKTSISKRDEIWSDDWVGLGIDTIGNQQSMYEFFVNPDGIQLDALRLASDEDSTVDWVWYSAGSRTEDGYIVEMKIPLRSLRYSTGENVDMGIIFFRKVSRLGMSSAWPELPPGKGWLNCTHKIQYSNLESSMKVEVLPSITSGSYWSRGTPERWSTADTNNEAGVSAKVGLTSSITLEGTYNPDFSQVESDAFQVEVNQRFPIFYSEKRPFFMEAGNLFDVAGAGGESNLLTTVHTRKIVDPRWGVKLTGEYGKATFAFLAASDESAGLSWDDEDEENPYLGHNADFLIGRVKYSLGGENYIGALYTGREQGASYNRVAGADFLFKFLDNHSVRGNFLYSFSDMPHDDWSGEGGSYNIRYDYYSKNLGAFLLAERISKDFRLDTGYIYRDGITRYVGWFCPQWYPEWEGMKWLKRARTFLFGIYMQDHDTGLDDYYAQFVLALFTDKSGWFRFDAQLQRESWEGVQYDKKFIRLWGELQPTNWLYFFTVMKLGDGIYYDEENPFMGDSLYWESTVKLQPFSNLEQYFTFTHESLVNPATDELEYNVNILQSKTTYQFDENLFLRAFVQYDSYREIVLADILLSFQLIPGTVAHIGYGSLHERLEWRNNEWLDETTMGRYYQTSQSLFFKVSYLFQL